MQRLRSLHHKNRYTQLANDAIDRLPDLESVGLLATILRHSDDFDFQMSVLIKSKPGLGEKRAYQARTTLIEHGYVVQVKFKHTYRGRFCTDVYRSAEPHTHDDLALLRERYQPGNNLAFADEDGRERLVTITWSEITSAAGRERIQGPAPVDNSASNDQQSSGREAKPQVVPDPAMAGSGTAGPGVPGPATADPGEARSFKEDCSESEREHPDPDGRTDEPASEDHNGGPHREAAVRLRARMNLAKVGAQPAQVRKVESAVERLLDAGFAEAVVEQHAQRKLGEANTCKYLLNGLAPEHVVEAPGAAAAPPPAHSVPAWCGECDREGRDKPAMRRIEIDGVVRRCPNCHPDAVSQP